MQINTQKVLIVEDGLVHPSLLARRRLRQALSAHPGFTLDRARSLEALVGRDLAAYRALVLYYHHETLSPSALHALETYLSAGGGVLAVHSATASFKQSLHYSELLGGRFTGHGPVGPFTLQPAADIDPAFAAVPSFTVTDELYRHEFYGEVQVQFTALLAGEAIPVVWLHPYGQGLVCYACPGHTAATVSHPAYQDLLRRALHRVAAHSGARP